MIREDESTSYSDSKKTSESASCTFRKQDESTSWSDSKGTSCTIRKSNAS